MLPKTRGAFHFSIPDPQHICKSRGSPYRSNVCTQTRDRSTRRKDAELYLLTRFSRDLARGLPRSRRCGRTGAVERMWIAIGSHFTFPELSGRRAKTKGVWRAAPGANMPRYAQLVMGPAGSGKSTYCATMVQHCEALNRSVQVVNLDPAAEHFSYSVMADIRELIEVDDVMEDDSLRFGPNGGLVFCMEYFTNNFDWLENCLGHVEDDYILFDCPGQIELYTHLPVMKQLVQQLEQWEFRVCGVFLVDSQFMVESFKFISGILAALSAMISLEIPQVNIMTKMDLLSKKAKKEIEKFLDPDMYSLLEDSTSDLRSKKFKKLTKAICGLIDDYSMVRFLPYDQSDEESMNIVLQHIDFAIQYGEDLEFKEPKEHEDESSSMFDEYFQECQDE
ncbi:GPN-loop GTPase 3 isoform X4 [Gorilla gorilla gorilla]|uniref:GPN-loop GTPase 3 isoform X4 n=1 Tax=Gorilla gorilla gorilla TaxID=9595 RepID=UPI0008F4F239|nr:GPN-loop GTPase 3 isoform X4 [Gorilla gorilla gorilla]